MPTVEGETERGGKKINQPNVGKEDLRGAVRPSSLTMTNEG